MEQLLERVKRKLAQGAFASEAAVSFGIVVPILEELGWDASEPDEVIPEFSSGRGRVDFALCTAARRPSVFIEVKGVGRSLEGDRQLFEYAFHQGVPLCLLTDGREWSFYLPSGQGSYEERRVYRLQIDERSATDSSTVFHRYLARERIKTGDALAAATADYRDAAAKREAARVLPRAWAQLLLGPEDLLVELLSDQVEAISGFRPTEVEVVSFLSNLEPRQSAPQNKVVVERLREAMQPSSQLLKARPPSGVIEYQIFGQRRSAKNGNAALLDVLALLAKHDLSLVPILASAVRGNTRNHIAQTVKEIYPARPDLARAVEFTPGWLVGTNVANREKVRIVRKACEVYNLEFGKDLTFNLPNE